MAREHADDLAMVALTGVATAVLAIGVIISESLGFSYARPLVSETPAIIIEDPRPSRKTEEPSSYHSPSRNERYDPPAVPSRI